MVIVILVFAGAKALHKGIWRSEPPLNDPVESVETEN
jgi:hypothetical protein